MVRLRMEDKKLYILAGYDDATEEQLAGLQKKLYEAGFEGKETKNIPMHITLGSFPTDREEELKADLQRIAAETESFEVQLSHIGIFPGGWVLFIAPDMNEKLQNLKEQFGTDPAWTAHTTMIIEEPSVICKALPIVIEGFAPLTGTVKKLHFYEFFPTRYIMSVDLR